jgi:hypothetical protein
MMKITYALTYYLTLCFPEKHRRYGHFRGNNDQLQGSNFIDNLKTIQYFYWYH